MHITQLYNIPVVLRGVYQAVSPSPDTPAYQVSLQNLMSQSVIGTDHANMFYNTIDTQNRTIVNSNIIA